MQTMAKSIAASKMFGVATEDQALALMLLCQAEGIHPVMALRRYHIIEGKPAYRADALQGEFEKEGAILWHERNEQECSATFFRDKRKVDAEAVKRAKESYRLMAGGSSAASLAEPGEITIIRTLADAIEKHVAQSWNKEKGEWKMKWNWQQSPRQMLHARCLTEGVRAINSGLVAGIYTEDEIIDMQPDLDQRPAAEIVERNVRAATANAQPVNSVTDQDGNITEMKASGDGLSNEYGPLVITVDNYRELKCHIGKEPGEMLLRKIGDLHPNILTWLHDKWIQRLSPSASDQDMRLKKAVEFAYKALKEQPQGAPESSQAPGPSQDTKEALIASLREKCSDLVLTEEQTCAYLNKYKVLAGEKNFSEVPESQLHYLNENWATAKGLIEIDVKPKVKEKRGRK